MSFGVSGLGPNAEQKDPQPLWGQAPRSRKVKSWAWCPTGRQGSISMVTRHTLDFCCIGLGEGREVTAGPRSPGQLWLEALILSPIIPSPHPSRTKSPARPFPKLNPERLPTPLSVSWTCPH